MLITLKNKRAIPEKLLAFGFRLLDGAYVYTKNIVDGQFLMTVAVRDLETLEAKVTDNASGEEYVLHLMDGAVGEFIGTVRAGYEALLDEIGSRCCETEVFKSVQAKELIEYVRITYGDELEFLWQKFPDNAVWRRADNSKWYAALLTVSGIKLGLSFDDKVEIIDLRMAPEEVVSVVDHKTYYPAWHMNKQNWITIILDGSVSFDELCRRLGDSYALAGR